MQHACAILGRLFFARIGRYVGFERSSEIFKVVFKPHSHLDESHVIYEQILNEFRRNYHNSCLLFFHYVITRPSSTPCPIYCSPCSPLTYNNLLGLIYRCNVYVYTCVYVYIYIYIYICVHISFVI